MAVFEHVESMGHEQVLFCNDKATNLKAIIAIHDTTLGPALGGCRMWDYESEHDALEDVLRLSRGMTYKASVSGLNLGGGKAVIIGDPKKLKSEAFFRTFGRFVNSLGGRYITAEDVNIRVSDMENVSQETKFVTGVSKKAGGSGDPSPVTALGVYHGIRASVFHKLGRDSVKGLKIAVQGCGAVGTSLCEFLHRDGAQLLVGDINEDKVQYIVDNFSGKAVDVNSIHGEDVDVYAPCALGGGLNDKTIPEIKASIVAGASNNQLLDENVHGEQLKKRDILYAPDYVINAGGLINVYQELIGYNQEAAKKQTSGIYDTLLQIYKQADDEGITTDHASNMIAEKRINDVRAMKDLKQTARNQTWS